MLAGVAAVVVPMLPAAADDADIGSGSVGITVLIEPLECAADCGGGPFPGIDLPATGLASPDSLLWIASALLAAGVVLALWARTTRHLRLAHTSPATAYAGLSGESDPTWEQPSAQEPAARRGTERGGTG
jgi:hypothetical protein